MFKIMFERLINFFFPPVKITEVEAKNNWDGIPIPGLKWKEVSTKTQDICPIVPMTMERVPSCCPICGDLLKEYQSDFWKFDEGGGQYMVCGDYCKRGHWTHLEWA